MPQPAAGIKMTISCHPGESAHGTRAGCQFLEYYVRSRAWKRSFPPCLGPMAASRFGRATADERVQKDTVLELAQSGRRRSTQLMSWVPEAEIRGYEFPAPRTVLKLANHLSISTGCEHTAVKKHASFRLSFLLRFRFCGDPRITSSDHFEDSIRWIAI